MALNKIKICLLVLLMVVFVSGCSAGLPTNKIVDLAGMTFCGNQINYSLPIRFFDEDSDYFSGASVFCPNTEPVPRNIESCNIVFKRPSSNIVGMIFIKERVRPPEQYFYLNIVKKKCMGMGVNMLYPIQDHALCKQGYNVYEAYYE